MPSLSRAYFEGLYAANIDPWSFRSSANDQARDMATVQALPNSYYEKALELGSARGELTFMLAPHCGQLTAVETSLTALAKARVRCREDARVRFVHAHLPDGDWAGPYDLVVLSEILYYFEPSDLVILADRVRACLTEDADVVLVHWTGPTDYPLTADEAIQLFTASGFTSHHHERCDTYRLDVLGRA